MTVRHLLGGAVLAAAATMLMASSASAQNRNFSFTTTFSPNPVGSLAPNTATSFITVTNGSNPSATTPTSIVLANLRTTSDAAVGTPASFNQNYAIAISITDTLTGQVLTNSLTGNLSGTLSNNTAAIANTFNQTSLTFNLAGGLGFYTLSNFSYVPPGDPSATSAGSIGASTVSFTSTQAPEPGSLALVATGMMGAMGMVVRRRRSAK